MLFYARYSPVEARGQRVVPILDRMIVSPVGLLDVVASQAVVRDIVGPDVLNSGAYTMDTLKMTGDERGGWELVRIRRVRT